MIYSRWFVLTAVAAVTMAYLLVVLMHRPEDVHAFFLEAADPKYYTFYGTFCGSFISITGSLYVAGFNLDRNRRKELALLRSAMEAVVVKCHIFRAEIYVPKSEGDPNLAESEAEADARRNFLDELLDLPAMLDADALRRPIQTYDGVIAFNRFIAILSRERATIEEAKGIAASLSIEDLNLLFAELRPELERIQQGARGMWNELNWQRDYKKQFEAWR